MPTKTTRKPPDQPQTEHEFLEQYDVAAFERPSVTVDVVMLTVRNRTLEVLLVKRTEHPFQGAWSLPGGFVGMNESLESAANRVLEAKTGLNNVYLEQLYTFGQPNRDPRTRVISVAQVALIAAERIEQLAQLETNDTIALGEINVPWEGETGGPVNIKLKGKPVKLAFDHHEIIGMAVKRLRGKLDYTPVGFQLLPERFTLRALQDIHETILGHTVNKDSFRRRMQFSGQLSATGDREEGTDYRPAEYYTFNTPSAI
jgi:8-oxo-dGTP diphosphatase